MQTATRSQVYSLILFAWGLFISQESDATVYYVNTTDVGSPLPPVPCTQMIHWSQDFADRQSIVECHSRQNPEITVAMKTTAPGQMAYFNPLDYDKDSLVWECVVKLTFSNICCRFAAWAANGHESEVCGGVHRCHQCKWVGVQYNVAMDSEQCFAKDAVDSKMVTPGANVNTVTPKSVGRTEVWNCYDWVQGPC